GPPGGRCGGGAAARRSDARDRLRPLAGASRTPRRRSSTEARVSLALIGEVLDRPHDRGVQAGERVRIAPERGVEEVEREVVLDVADIAPGQDGRLTLLEHTDKGLRDLADVREAVVAGAEAVAVPDDRRAGGNRGESQRKKRRQPARAGPEQQRRDRDRGEDRRELRRERLRRPVEREDRPDPRVGERAEPEWPHG